MPNVFDANGLQVQTRAELVAYFTTKYQEIYGNDIDVSSNTPDGQMMNIFIQSVLDVQDLLVQINNGFDPDFAIGRTLDQRAAINGIQRQAGTYTITPISIDNTQSVNLYGLDQDAQEPFTVQDNAGNKWLLQVTQLGVLPGTSVFDFRAEFPGQVLTIPNTITVPVTIVLGVSSVNNPTSYTTLGINEESDAQFRVRRQQSVSLSSQGYLRGLLAALENINGVTFAAVYENTGDVEDSDEIPGHSIWVVVSGTGLAADIAQAIYTKRNAGCGMKGDVTYDVNQIDGTVFTVRWDNVITKNIFIFFMATSINGVVSPNVQAIRQGLVTSFVPGIDEEIDVNQLATAVQEIDPNTLVTNAGFSSGEEQTLTLSGVAASGTFKLNYNGLQTAAINWNDAVGTIQSKLQAVTGLDMATVTGSIASQSIVIDLSAVEGIDGLIYASDNSLQTSAPAAITFAYAYGPELTMIAPKQYRLIVSEENIVITALVLRGSVSIIESAGNAQFTAVGGYGAYTFSFQTNFSGGSIDASTGLYTAGGFAGIDTIKVADKLGNSATATITVV